MTADTFIEALRPNVSEKEKEKLQRFYKGDNPDTAAFGVRFGTVFKTAREFTDLPLDQVERLMESDFYEVRMGAMAILDYKARKKKITDDQRKELFDLYMRRHDRIDNWDLVDRAAPHDVGGYLFDKSRDPIYELALSENQWKRRTALYSTLFFLKRGDTQDTMRLAGELVNDLEDLVNKAVGTLLREVGKTDENLLTAFLDRTAATMPRTTLRYAIEKLAPPHKRRYLEFSNPGR